MNRHYAQGFQRVFLNDLNDVEPQLQAYDPHLYLMYNPHTDEHLIMDGLLELAVMRIPQIGFRNLNSSIIPHIQKIHHGNNGFKASDVVDASEVAIQKELDRKTDDLSYNYAKDVEKAVRTLAYTGA